MLVAPETVHRHLARLPQRRSLDAALVLFDALGYELYGLTDEELTIVERQSGARGG